MAQIARITVLFLFAALALLSLVPEQSEAGRDVRLLARNTTQSPFKVFGETNNCWQDGGFLPSRAPVVPAKYGEETQINGELTAGGSCIDDPSWTTIDLAFDLPGLGYQPSASRAQAYPTADSPVGWSIWFDDRLNMHSQPTKWLPVNPTQVGSAGPGGLYCISQYDGNRDTINMEGKPKPDCSAGISRHPDGVRKAKGLRPAKAGPGKLTDGQQVVYDVFTMGRAACEMLNPGRAWRDAGCNEIDQAPKWDLDNLTADVRDTKAEGDAKVIRSYKKIVDQNEPNPTDVAGSLNYNLSYAKTRTTSNSTGFGYKFGEKFSIKSGLKIPVISGETSAEFSSEQNWSDTKTTTDTLTETISNGATQPTQPHGRTYVLAFQAKGDLNFNFSADLTAGKKNTAESIKTPMARSLGMTAARVNPCLGYMVGSQDPSSLQGLARLAAARGLSPQTAGLPDNQKAYLRAMPGFSVAADDNCPGFPDGYPGQSSFKGTGSATGSSAGPMDVSWDPGLGAITTCVYFEKDKTSEAPAVQAPFDPCAAGPHPPGAVVNGNDSAPGATLRAGDGGTLILANDEPASGNLKVPGGESVGGSGHDVLQGSEYGERLDGGPGDDIVMGEAGSDELDGGAGDDSLSAGPGDDLLSDAVGDNGLLGEDGDDTLTSSKSAGGGMMGGVGNDTLIMNGKGPVTLVGGEGNDRFRLNAGARPGSVVELDDEGIDTVDTERSIDLPVNVERGRVVSSKPVNLKAGIGSQSLAGGSGANLLNAGAGSDLVEGKAGNDRLILGNGGFDLARGGKGADQFVVRTARAPKLSTQIGRDFRGAASAHTVADLKPSQGDRLVLSVKTYGKAIKKMRRNFKVTFGNRPKGGGAQFLFLPGRKLLSFDPDGRGGAVASVVAILKGHDSVPRKAIRIVGK